MRPIKKIARRIIMRTCNLRTWEDVVREPNAKLFKQKKAQVVFGRVKAKVMLQNILRA